MPATAGDALQQARARLVTTSRNPRRDAELLLTHVLRCDLVALLAHPERPLSASEAIQYESVLMRRLRSEPMQYITGQQEFYGLAFEVSPDVLIPRPETEHLVEAVLKHVKPNASIIDVGTGSGAIAVALARALPQAQVVAVDLSPAALEVARRNARRNEVSDRVTFLQSDLLDAVEGGDFDAIVSNPPYVADGEVLEPQVSNYEPHAALYAGPTGLEVYERLVPQARKRLKPNGWLMLEIGFGQQAGVETLLHDWSALSLVPDLQGIPRVIQAQKS
jgi:release factor glutamine methyltransferase